MVPAQINNRDEAIQWLYDRIDYERTRPSPMLNPFRLERIERLLKKIGSPQERIPAIHIAGTKGKGSTAAMIDSILRASGVRTGLFTSPHIEAFEERMRVSGRMPNPDQLTDLVSKLAGLLHASELESSDRTPTFFEISTLLAWMFFDEEKVEIAVLETGLGGRLDCTNVCRPLVNIITSIGLDHTHILGDTLSLIAAEKAGILKQGVPVVQGQLPETADLVVTARANELKCPQFVCGRDFAWHIDHNDNPLSGRRRSQKIFVLTPTKSYDALTIPLLGDHQAHNASLAVMTAEILHDAGYRKIDDTAIAQGLRSIHWPLRFEVFDQTPVIVLDAAHNPDSMRAVAGVLTNGEWSNRRRVLVFAASADKDARSMIEIICPHFDVVVFTRFLGNPRSLQPEDLLAISESLEFDGTATRFETAPNPTDALTEARTIAGPLGVVVVTGSIFLASEVRSLLRHDRP